MCTNQHEKCRNHNWFHVAGSYIICQGGVRDKDEEEDISHKHICIYMWLSRIKGSFHFKMFLKVLQLCYLFLFAKINCFLNINFKNWGYISFFLIIWLIPKLLHREKEHFDNFVGFHVLLSKFKLSANIKENLRPLRISRTFPNASKHWPILSSGHHSWSF